MSLADRAIDSEQARFIPDNPDPNEELTQLADTRSFLWHYLKGRKWHFLLLTTSVVSAACCAVLIQYVMKLLIDGMTAESGRDISSVWTALAFFISLVVIESML